MSKRRRSAQVTYLRFLRQTQKLLHPFLRRLARSFLILLGLGQRHRNAGFVLPTVALLLVVMTLTIGVMTLRGVNRAQQVIGERQDRVIYNAASPAIDRAKAKLEYLFSNDPRLPTAIPGEATLTSMMLNDSTNGVYELGEDGADGPPYTLEDETRLDLDGDGTVDNAWYFTPASSPNSIVAYSILWGTPPTDGDDDLPDLVDSEKAAALYSRTAPFDILATDSACQGVGGVNTELEAGWSPTPRSSELRKNFQIDAFVINNRGDQNQAAATLEVVQERLADRGNKWGAWFRNDLEINPGPIFRWNGAMHTEGSLFIDLGDAPDIPDDPEDIADPDDPEGGSDDPKFRGYLVSAPTSCIYSKEASQISVTKIEGDGELPFEGQVVVGSIEYNASLATDEGAGFLHIYTPEEPIYEETDERTVLLPSNDSVTDTPTPAQVALDPLVLFTQDVSQSRYTDPSNETIRDSAWEDAASPTLSDRAINKQEATPYVDDTYRADNRYGPKPRYGRENSTDPDLTFDSVIGTDISSGTSKLIRNTPSNNDREQVGYDGYWERRARQEGLRIVVGERLQLGDVALAQAGVDTLSPYDTFQTYTSTGQGGHQGFQRRTLTDNLAAVQGTAIYHYKYPSASAMTPFTVPYTGHSSGYEPIACLATTFHPGTPATVANSIRFNEYNDLVDGLYSDFFNGYGTDGWEYAPPDPTDSDMETALDNLANAYGDAEGAFPPTQETSGTQIHPDPVTTQFGNFSNLRRALAAGSYSSLSIADRSYLDTAACTLGILGDNVNRLQDISYSTFSSDLTDLETDLGALGLGNAPPFQYVAELPDSTTDEIRRKKVARLITLKEQVTYDLDPNNYECEIAEEAGDLNRLCATPGTVIRADVNNGDTTITLENTNWIAVNQDILLDGNVYTVTAIDTGLNTVTVTPSVSSAITYNATDPAFVTYAPVTTTANFTQPAVGSTVNVDVTNNKVDWSASWRTISIQGGGLYKFVTKVDGNTITVRNTGAPGNTAPTTNITSGKTVADAPQKYTVLATIFNGVAPADIALTPRDDTGDFETPIDDSGIPENKITDPDGNDQYVAFLDRALFNGREEMNVRVMNLDLDLLRQTTIGGDTWLPMSGIVYAFREDAVREDAIARPEAASWGSCDSLAELEGTDCQMGANPTSPQDPPVNEDNGISTKPIDFYPDPDRRPYGFRLLNGADLARVGIDDEDNFAGLSFISDNPVYIQGDFNLHRDSGGNALQEYEGSSVLANNWSNFYSRAANDRNTDFARPTTDRWRPSEILGDAITILSSQFCDGSVQDYFARATDGLSDATEYFGRDVTTTANTNPNNDRINNSGASAYSGLLYPTCENNIDSSARLATSYLNANRPSDRIGASGTIADHYFVRQNPFDNFSPIIVDRNGKPRISVDPTSASQLIKTFDAWDSSGEDYYDFTDRRPKNNATNPTTINTIIVSGIIPSREGGIYGGLHNFPRFIENWNVFNLTGSFLQLNFSTQATGLFDQDGWEPGTVPETDVENIKYYDAPDRRWGYDVGLQYAPAGPVASRFVTLGRTRSEFYNQLGADDFFIRNLRCAAHTDGNKIDPSISDDQCAYLN